MFINVFKIYEVRNEFDNKWGRRESNSRHLRLQRSALPLSYSPIRNKGKIMYIKLIFVPYYFIYLIVML